MFQIETISAKMLDYYVERSDAVIIDLRDPAAYRRGHVRNAANIPYRELEEYLEKKQEPGMHRIRTGKRYHARQTGGHERQPGVHDASSGRQLCHR